MPPRGIMATRSDYSGMHTDTDRVAPLRALIASNIRGDHPDCLIYPKFPTLHPHFLFAHGHFAQFTTCQCTRSWSDSISIDSFPLHQVQRPPMQTRSHAFVLTCINSKLIAQSYSLQALPKPLSMHALACKNLK